MSKGKAIAQAALVALVAGTGCWEQVDRHWFDQMKNGPAVQTYAKPPFDPPEGTIPAGGMPERILSDNPMFATPMYAPEARLIQNPIPSSPESVARGKHEFETYCAVCHGEDGLAAPTPDHPVTQKLGAAGAPPFPLSATPSYTDGMLYTKIRYGKPLMPAYPQISPEDRWHIINYIRTFFKGVS